jgi:uncharacterized damage-inducible protein DinB
MSDLQYPVGRFAFDPAVTDEKRRLWIAEIAAAPGKLRAAVNGLDDARLDTPYRPGGWTVRQVVHHVPDSHLNAYIRMRLALTETNPTIRPYDQSAWAGLNDASIAPPAVSLALLEALHRRWVLLLTSLDPTDWARPLQHPEAGPMTIDTLLQLYAWHGRHHTAHITELRKREGWD